MARRMLPNSPEEVAPPELVVLQVVRHHAVVDHDDLVVFLLVEKAELLDDDVGVAPASGAGGVDAALRDLTAEVIRQGLGVS